MRIIKKVILRGALLLVAATFLACPGKMDPAATLNGYMQQEYLHSELIPVYVVSNRSGVGQDCRNQSFGVESAPSLRFGICEINVPEQHAIGTIELSAASTADPKRWFKLGRYRSRDITKFLSELGSQSGQSVLVFVHGFNVKFEEAVMRAAQIRYDVKHQGPIVLFSWPAGSTEGLLQQFLLNQTYAQNKTNAANSVTHFSAFWRQLAASEHRPLHLVVHSMGHQVVLPALSQLNTEGQKQLVAELVLNAPDYATLDFKKEAAGLRSISRRVTLYCSPGDNALIASVQFNGSHRIGQCARVDGIDVINVNEIDDPVLGVGGLGHGYYSGRAILTDLYQTILGVAVQKRLFIRASGPNNPENYILRN
ncbi:MAG: alpha/beta hydrolase [Leptospiraceae bacterium]|nr:alpha/beta hydrolase [Leptospiraceae bacterium]